jgi:hypothetical protein
MTIDPSDETDLLTTVIARYRARGIPEEAVAFARRVVAASVPLGAARARALLWACSRLGAFGISVGLDPVPPVLLHPSVIERFVGVGLGGASDAARRTMRTNLRFVALRAAPELPHQPGPAALPRDRAKGPYLGAEIAAYFALARSQPTPTKRHRLIGLLCLGLGAGLDGEDIRYVRGTHVTERFGALVVDVSQGPRARVVPVLSRYTRDLRASAAFAGEGFVCGGVSPTRKNVTAPLTARICGGTDLPRLDTGRLRSTWLAEHLLALGVPALLRAAGISCSQRLGDLCRHLPEVDDEEMVTLLGANS